MHSSDCATSCTSYALSWQSTQTNDMTFIQVDFPDPRQFQLKQWVHIIHHFHFILYSKTISISDIYVWLYCLDHLTITIRLDRISVLSDDYFSDAFDAIIDWKLDDAINKYVRQEHQLSYSEFTLSYLMIGLVHQFFDQSSGNCDKVSTQFEIPMVKN